MMKKLCKYGLLFVWVVVFLHYYGQFMPKNILFPIVGIPVLFISWNAISRFLDKVLE